MGSSKLLTYIIESESSTWKTGLTTTKNIFTYTDLQVLSVSLK